MNPDKRARTTFWDARFLGLAAILGAGCSATYYVTGGSLVAAAVTHWVPVNLWLFLLGALTFTQGAGTGVGMLAFELLLVWHAAGPAVAWMMQGSARPLILKSLLPSAQCCVDRRTNVVRIACAVTSRVACEVLAVVLQAAGTRSRARSPLSTRRTEGEQYSFLISDGSRRTRRLPRAAPARTVS